MENENKSIAFLCHPYHRGGVTRWMADAAIEYSKKRYTVYFITVDPAQPFFSGQNRETMLELLNRVEVGFNIIKAVVGREFEFGTPEYCVYVYKKLLARLPLGIPVILSDDGMVWQAAAALHGSYPIIGVLHADEQHYYDLAVKYSSDTDALVCVSNRVSNTIKGKLPKASHDHIYLIPCGINLPEVNVPYEEEKKLHLVYAGRIDDYQKRAGDLLKIAIELSNRGVSFHMNIIGEGPAKAALEKGFKDAGLEKQATFRGWLVQKAVAVYMSESDVVVLTSDFEGTPIAMMEAFAAGCGVVGTRVSGIEDYEHDALAANCFEVYAVGDIDDAVAKIMAVAAIPRPARRAAARKLAEARFSMDVCLKKYLTVIKELPSRTYTKTPVSISAIDVLKSNVVALMRYMKVRYSRK